MPAAIKNNNKMDANLTVRQAAINDIDFVIEALIEADKSGSQMISTCSIFALSEDEYKEILRDILSQDIENYDYYLSGFLIAELNGEYVGASGSWLEGGDGTPSGVIKSTMLFPYLDKAKISDIKNNIQIIKGSNLPREAGALQLEYVYVREKYRGHGIFTKVVRENIERNLSKYTFSKVQSILFKENYKSYSAFLKFGYKVVEERKAENPEILRFFPFNVKILMEFYLDK